jgi:hypothetical protein
MTHLNLCIGGIQGKHDARNLTQITKYGGIPQLLMKANPVFYYKCTPTTMMNVS